MVKRTQLYNGIILLLSIASIASIAYAAQPANKLSFQDRLEVEEHSVKKRLFEIALKKSSNLIVAADARTKEALLNLTTKVAPYICALKLHIDCIEDFDQELINLLKISAMEHDFLLFQDSKFNDIGSTVQQQFRSGMYKIASWADLVTVSATPGPGALEAIKKVCEEDKRECGMVVVAQMSSRGSLTDKFYCNKAQAVMQDYKEFVVGAIAQDYILDTSFIKMTPGVHMTASGDNLAQRYKTPEEAIQHGADFIIVGRGIYWQDDMAEAAAEYQKAGWEAYQMLVEK